jgi:hypothetical protein
MTPKLDIPADVAVVVSVWVIVWLLVFATALSRKDFEPITRLTWVLVMSPFLELYFFGWLRQKLRPRKHRDLR